MMRSLLKIAVFGIQVMALLLVITAIEFTVFVSSPAARQEMGKYILKYYPELVDGDVVMASQEVDTRLPLMAYWRFYFLWMTNILKDWNWGYSQFSGEPLSHLWGYPLRTTLLLAVMGLLFSTGIALFLVFLQRNWGESRPVRWFLQGTRFVSSIHYIILAYFVYYGLNLKNPPLIIPVLIIAVGNGVLTDTLDLISEDLKNIFSSRYYQGIRARGSNVYRHLAKPFTISLVRIMNAKFPMLLGGTFIVEYIMNIRAMGLETIQAVLQDDHLKLLVITFLVTIFILSSNFFNRLVQQKLDPRPVIEI
ncbi:MAG: hypothetical protein GXO78_05745 [Calditrichaeota bacterium]|nr:hypothetical protein [Calditrichota bacterium]